MQREKKERPPKKKNRKKMHMLLPLPLLFSFFLGCPLFPFTPTAPLLVLTLFVLFSLLSLETVRNAKRQQFCPFVLVGFSLSLSRDSKTHKKKTSQNEPLFHCGLSVGRCNPTADALTKRGLSRLLTSHWVLGDH